MIAASYFSFEVENEKLFYASLVVYRPRLSSIGATLLDSLRGRNAAVREREREDRQAVVQVRHDREKSKLEICLIFWSTVKIFKKKKSKNNKE